jgi:hypothetical protein
MIILYKKEDETVGIVNPSPNVRLNDVIKRDVPKGTSYVIITDSQMPLENDLLDFSDALIVDFNNSENPQIGFDIEIAKDITRKRLRKERISLFEKTDLLIRDAMIENNQEKLEIAINERDRLRDITLLVDQKNTLDQLRQIHP